MTRSSGASGRAGVECTPSQWLFSGTDHRHHQRRRRRRRLDSDHPSYEHSGCAALTAAPPRRRPSSVSTSWFGKWIKVRKISRKHVTQLMSFWKHTSFPHPVCRTLFQSTHPFCSSPPPVRTLLQIAAIALSLPPPPPPPSIQSALAPQKMCRPRPTLPSIAACRSLLLSSALPRPHPTGQRSRAGPARRPQLSSRRRGGMQSPLAHFLPARSFSAFLCFPFQNAPTECSDLHPSSAPPSICRRLPLPSYRLQNVQQTHMPCGEGNIAPRNSVNVFGERLVCPCLQKCFSSVQSDPSARLRIYITCI